MAFSQEQILNALRHVDDPDLKKDLVSLNMIQNIAVDGMKVTFDVVLTTPACPLKEKIKQDCIAAVREHVSPGLEVEPHMTSNVTQSIEVPELKNVKNIIAVISGKGGVGKSTVASNLAVGLAKNGAKVALVDADIYGPSMPIMFGLEGQQPMVRKKNDKDMMVPFEQHGVKLNSIGFLVPAEQAIIWRGPMASKALNQLVFDTDWGDEVIDYLILDMPPGTGDLHLTLVQRMSVSGVVVVTTPQDVAIADARKGAMMFKHGNINIPVLGLIENMAYFTPDDMPDKKYFIFGQDGGQKLADELEIPLLGQIPLTEKMRSEADAGRPLALDLENPIGQAFYELSQNVAQQIAISNAKGQGGTRVEIKEY